MTAKAFRAEQLRAFGTSWTRRRPWFVGPVMATVLVLLYLGGLERARLVAFAGISLSLFAIQIASAIVTRRREVDDRGVFFRQLTTTGAIFAYVAVTGGLSSPLTPVLVGPAITIVVTFGRSRESALTLGALALGVVILALTDPLVELPPLNRPYAPAVTAVALLLAIVLIWRDVTGLADAYGRAGVSLDRLRERVLEQSAAKSRELESVGARVAHELKNPLASIKGLAQLLSRSPDGPRAAERLAVIEGEVDRMGGILEEYLSFSRPLSVIERDRVAMRAIADDAVTVLEGRASAAGIMLSARGDDAVVEGDPRRLKEAMLNLVSNAVEATPRGGTVAVTTEALDAGALVTVRDTGKGMSAEVLARVGTPYFTTRDKGTGLGVVLARAVIVQHGGTLSYDSEEGAGTTATMYLPRRGGADGDGSGGG